MNEKKYGNERFWAFIGDGWSEKEIAIWKGPKEQEEIIARAKNKYEARLIIDALLNYTLVEDKNGLGNKEVAFLEFVCANCNEPYATMASNAILWKDREVFNKLKNDFPTIYG